MLYEVITSQGNRVHKYQNVRGYQRQFMPPETPFLLVPEVGPELGAIATVESGSEVGVALFQMPYFESKDLGCTP